MAKEFGIYPETSVPHYWIGCRGVINRGYLNIPWDRWSSEFHSIARKQELIDWVNNVALKELEKRVKDYNSTKGYFDSGDGKFRCEYDDRRSGGYLYMGFYNLTIEERD